MKRGHDPCHQISASRRASCWATRYKFSHVVLCTNAVEMNNCNITWTNKRNSCQWGSSVTLPVRAESSLGPAEVHSGVQDKLILRYDKSKHHIGFPGLHHSSFIPHEIAPYKSKSMPLVQTPRILLPYFIHSCIQQMTISTNQVPGSVLGTWEFSNKRALNIRMKYKVLCTCKLCKEQRM
jgi:hypothetical protein